MLKACTQPCYRCVSASQSPCTGTLAFINPIAAGLLPPGYDEAHDSD